MVVIKINADTQQEREVKIVSDDGTWKSGSYHIYKAKSLDDIETGEPEDTNTPDYLGKLILDKEKSTSQFETGNLTSEEQQEIATFVMDYTAPDGVY